MNMLNIENRAVAIAKTWQGTPYQHQASVKNIGCDCLGLLRGIWRELYGEEPEPMPHYAARWMDALDNKKLRTDPSPNDPLLNMANKYFDRIEPYVDIKKADILLFNYRSHLPVRHIGIAVSNQRFIHAYAGRGVVENRLSAWWTRHMVGHYGWVKNAANS